jgi:three-Cys-motif partner protein
VLLPGGLDAEHYELDDADGHVRQIVGAWAKDKQARLERYVQISAPARRKWSSVGATYIDLFCGTAKCRVRESDEVIDGSPMTAWRRATSRSSSFTHVVVSDAHPVISEAARFRLAAAGAPVTSLVGTAEETIGRTLSIVPRSGLHLAFLDPFDLASLPFDVVRQLAQLDRMDILIHVSLFDLSRNLRRYISADASALDVFMPGWRAAVDVDRPDSHVRAELFAYWRGLLGTVGMKTSEAAELVTGPNEQPLYWLAFAARHPLALKFWEEVRQLPGKKSPQLKAL